MDDRYEQLTAIGYMLRLVAAGRVDARARRFVFDWFEDHAVTVGIDPPCSAKQRRGKSLGLVEIHHALEKRAAALRGARRSVTEIGIDHVARSLRLDRLDRSLLGALIRTDAVSPGCIIYDQWQIHDVRQRGQSQASFLSTILGARLHEVAARLGKGGRLATCGLVTVDRLGGVTPLKCVLDAVRAPASGQIVDRLLGARCVPQLKWDDFDHIAEDRDHVGRVLRGAVRHAARGVHVLLYGPPGTGKTELCRVLAAEIGLPLYAVGEAEEDGGEPSREERLAAYRLASGLVGPQKAMLLFDEIEDLFPRTSHFGAFPAESSEHGSGSGVYVHKMLENAPVPTLWTSNSLHALGRAVIRRMTCAVNMSIPPARVRSRIWRRTLNQHAVAFVDEEVDNLARRYEVPPALVANGARAAWLAGGKMDDGRRAVGLIARALHCDRPSDRYKGSDFRIELANAATDLEALVERLASDNTPRDVSLCLQGAPGTGKSLFARYLATRMGMEVVERRASDLLSKYWGESEKNIAGAFEEARQRNAFLVIDEADSLLSSRRGATYNWEVSEVNELLTGMEFHDQPFVCTTNLPERLDEAALRRFTFRIAFRYLTAQQARAGFRHFFGLEAPAMLDDLATLTPGDFAVVRERAAIAGTPVDADGFVEALAGECDAKPGARRGIGFSARL